MNWRRLRPFCGTVPEGLSWMLEADFDGYGFSSGRRLTLLLRGDGALFELWFRSPLSRCVLSWPYSAAHARLFIELRFPVGGRWVRDFDVRYAELERQLGLLSSRRDPAMAVRILEP